MSSNRPKLPMNILDKRIPRNPKYENVQSTINTGDSLTNFLKRNEELRVSSKQQAGEVFKRMKISTLVQLIIQVEEINSLDTPKNTEYASQRTLINTDRSLINLETTRSTLQSVISGIGEMDVYNNYQKPKTSFNEFNERPYLIVDLRDKDEFKINHIISAHHYPAAMLSRCSNSESKELLIYKNQKGKMIILYDEDERIAPNAATIMIERGYNNVFILSGGLKYAVQRFPRGLLTGSCPLSWTSPNTSLTKFNRLASTTQPSPGQMITFNTHEQFTNHDIEELNTLLEKNLLLTSRSTTSKQTPRSSIASQRSNLSNISDKPWKP